MEQDWHHQSYSVHAQQLHLTPARRLIRRPNGLMQLPSFDYLPCHVQVLTIGYLSSIDEVIVINQPEQLKQTSYSSGGRRRVQSRDFSHQN